MPLPKKIFVLKTSHTANKFQRILVKDYDNTSSQTKLHAFIRTNKETFNAISNLVQQH
jgi:hypothetical protein